MNYKLQAARRAAHPAFFLTAFLLLQSALGQTLKVDGVTALSADKRGYCYVATGSSVAMYGAQLEPLARYTCSFGKIASIDASDPFKILLFCKDFLRVLLLDSKLAALGSPIFLPDVNVLRPAAVCRSSSGNGLWVADAYRRQLLYLDFALNAAREAALLDAYVADGEQHVSGMVEREGNVFLNLSGKSIAAFDKFGALLHLFSVPCISWFDVQGSELYYLSGGNLYAQNMLAWSDLPRLIATGVERCAVAGSAIYTYSGGVLTKGTLR